MSVIILIKWKSFSLNAKQFISLRIKNIVLKEQLYDFMIIYSETQKKKKELSCGKPVNHTQYDHLRGIANRNEHGHIPEPEVALIFKKKGSKNSHVDINELEEKLKKMKKDVSSFPIQEVILNFRMDCCKLVKILINEAAVQLMHQF